MINVTASNCAFNIQFCICFLSFFVSSTCNAFQLATWFFSTLFKVNLVNVLCQNSACLLGRCIDGHARDWHSIAIYQYISIAESRAGDVCHTVSARCWALKVSLRTKVVYTTLPNGSGSLLLLLPPKHLLMS